MASEYAARRHQLDEGWKEMARAQPALMDAFGRLHRTAVSEGVLSTKTKELMAVAVATAIHCDGCIAVHVRDALRAGATMEEIDEALGVALLLGGGAAAVVAVDARRAAAEFSADFEARARTAGRPK